MQVASLTAKKMTAAYASCEESTVLENIIEGRYQIVFFTPESLLRNQRWREMLCSDIYINNLVGLAVDEVHCVTKWCPGLFSRACICTPGDEATSILAS